MDHAAADLAAVLFAAACLTAVDHAAATLAAVKVDAAKPAAVKVAAVRLTAAKVEYKTGDMANVTPSIRVQFHASQPELDAIDTWAAGAGLSRSEAIRSLCRKALGSSQVLAEIEGLRKDIQAFCLLRERPADPIDFWEHEDLQRGTKTELYADMPVADVEDIGLRPGPSLPVAPDTRPRRTKLEPGSLADRMFRAWTERAPDHVFALGESLANLGLSAADQARALNELARSGHCVRSNDEGKIRFTLAR